MDTDTHDVAIIGGGAAGLNAALVLGRARRRVVVIDAGAPRNAPAAHMQGYLSRDGMPPSELLAAGRAEVRRYGVELVEDRVADAIPGSTLRLAGGRTVSARQVLVATGAADLLPEVAGVRERWGRDFLHCPYCHGWEVRDRPLGVLGTGPGSVDHAHLLRQWTDDLVFFTHTAEVSSEERAALRARGVEVVDGPVERLEVLDDRLQAVRLADGRRVAREAVFIRPALVPQAPELLAALGCELVDGGFVRTDAEGRTSVPGVWAAGNVTNPRAQVVTAAGEGSAVAIAINTELVEDDVRTAARRVDAADVA
jgi:thioredoxin reductase